MAKYNDKWSEEEDLILLKNFCMMRRKDLITLLPGRSPAACEGRAMYLLTLGHEFKLPEDTL